MVDVSHEDARAALSNGLYVYCPMGFDVIVKASAGRTARENVLAWLEDNRERLHAKLEELKGCQEYGVQVVMDWKRALEAMSRSSEKVLALGREMAGKPEGIRYLYRERIERVLRAEAEAAASAACRDCCERVSRRRARRLARPGRVVQRDRRRRVHRASHGLHTVSRASGERTRPRSRPARVAAEGRSNTNLIDVWARLALVGIELVAVEARIVIASVETYLKYAEAVGLTHLAAVPAA